MKPNIEIFESLVSNQKSGWHKDAEKRHLEKSWKDKAFNIALTLLKYKDANKLTQTELADKIGVSKQYINRVLQGKENLTLETICKIENALQINIIAVNIYSYEIEKFSTKIPTQSISYNKSSLFKIESPYENYSKNKSA